MCHISKVVLFRVDGHGKILVTITVQVFRALTYGDNNYKIHFSSPANANQPVGVTQTEPEIDSLQLLNKVVSSEVNRDLASVIGAPGSFTQLVEGSIPKGRSDFTIKASMPDPARVAASELNKILKNSNIALSGKLLITEKSPGDSVILVADQSSPALRDLIVPLNKESVNLFAEHLLREIGRAQKGSSSIDSSTIALKEFWREKNINLSGFYPTDGSGLSRSNGICPETLAGDPPLYVQQFKPGCFLQIVTGGRP